MLVDRASRLADEYGSYTARVYSHVAAVSRPSVKTWQPPPLGVVKLNVDASCADVGWICLGVVGRDSSGAVLFFVVRWMKAFWSPEL